MSSLVAFYRKKLLIPPHWQIDVRIECRDESDVPALASMSWEVLCNANYCLRVWCDISDQDVEWAVMHELLEGMTAPYANFCKELIAELRASKGRKMAKQERHREIRDETVEWLLDILAPDTVSPHAVVERLSAPAEGSRLGGTANYNGMGRRRMNVTNEPFSSLFYEQRRKQQEKGGCDDGELRRERHDEYSRSRRRLSACS